MKKVSLSAVLLMLAMSMTIALGITVFPHNTVKAAGDVAINNTNFPDANFRNWLLSQTYGADGILTEEEIASVTTIDVQSKNISDLTGIERFTALIRLNCSDNQLTGLNVSENINLDDLDCHNNQLTSLDVSDNTKLFRLYSTDNKLTKLIVGVKNDLRFLYCDNNQLTSLDVSKCPELRELYCSNNQLTGLDVSNCPKLDELECYKNQLTSLDLSANTEITYVVCGDNQLTSLELGDISKLSWLACSRNRLTGLDVSKDAALVYFYCSENQLTDLDVSKNIKLDTFKCDNNLLTGLDLSRNTKLFDLYCQNNRLTVLDVSRSAKLYRLDSSDNPLDKVYLPKESNNYKTPTGAGSVVLSSADWKYSGAEWNLDNDPSKTTALAKFDCIKEGEEDYSVREEMDVTTLSFAAPDCENAGKAEYSAELASGISRTGEAVTETKEADIPALGHKWGNWKETKPATVKEQGEKQHTCSVCGAVEKRVIPKLTPVPTKKADPTKKPAKPTATPTAKPEPTKKADPAKKPAKPTATPTAKPEPTKKTEPTKKAEPTKSADVSFKLNKTKVNIVCGKEDKLKATLKGASGKISWKTSDKKIAAVDANGKVTAKMAGTVTIIASAAGKTATCEVTVLYKDVTNTKDFWYKPTNCLTAKGVVKGYDKQTRFKPANKCTRAQMVTFIWRLTGEPAPKAKTCKFKDVKKTDYFYKACIWGNEKHIVEGYKDGTFGPQIVCARRHAVTFLWRLAGKPKSKTSKNPFNDVKKSDYFYKATLWASEQKILAGYSDGTFRPNGDCLRRQMVTFLYKYDKFINGKG